MTLRMRLRIAAVAAIAATGLMVGLAVAATAHANGTHVNAGYNETHTNFGDVLAGIALNAID